MLDHVESVQEGEEKPDLTPDVTAKLIDMQQAQERITTPEFAERYEGALAVMERAEKLGLHTLAQRMRAQLDGVSEWPKAVPESEGPAAALLADRDTALILAGDTKKPNSDPSLDGEQHPADTELLMVVGRDPAILESIHKLAQLLGAPDDVALNFEATDRLKQNDEVFRGTGSDIHDIEVAQVPIHLEGSSLNQVFEVVRGLGDRMNPHYEVRVRESEMNE